MRRVFDTVSSIAGLVLLSPLFALLAIAIKLKGGRGPVFYLQPRVGKHGCEFHLIKFRSMITGADRQSALTVAEDPRITRVGHFLRKYKLDELPQLINVVKGDMQLVGPRPEMKRYVEMFPNEYHALLRDLPGITDPASLVYRHEEQMLRAESPEDYYISQILPHKLRLSVEYSHKRTFFSDLKIICQTLGAAKSGEESSSSSFT